MTDINLTVAIFTYNRFYYLRRQIEIFYRFGVNINLVVLDGSSIITEKKRNQLLCDKYKINYYFNPSLIERHLVIKKFSRGKFLAYCSDDDVIDPRFYIKAVKFLKKNKNYNVVSGRLQCLHYIKKYKYLGFRYVNHLPNDYDISQGDFLEKLFRRNEAYLLGCPPTYYGVRRLCTHLKFTENLKKIKFLNNLELIESFSNIFTGGICTIPEFMGFRDYSSAPTSNDNRYPKSNTQNKDSNMIKKFLKVNINSYFVNKNVLNYVIKSSISTPRKITARDNGLLIRNKNFFQKLIISFLMITNMFFFRKGFGFDKKFYKIFRSAHFRMLKNIKF